MPNPNAGPVLSHVPVRTIEREELRQELSRGIKLVMCLGEWAFLAKRIPGSIHFKIDGFQLVSGIRFQNHAGFSEVDVVIENGYADVLVVDDVEVFRLVELAGVRVGGLEELGPLVVDHRLGDVDAVALRRTAAVLGRDQFAHVEVLLHAGEVSPRGETGKGCGGQDLELVAEGPGTDLLAGEIGRRGDVGVLRELCQEAQPQRG